MGFVIFLSAGRFRPGVAVLPFVTSFRLDCVFLRPLFLSCRDIILILFFGRYKGIRPLLGHIREGFSILSTGCTSLLAEPIARTEYPLRFWRGLLRSLERAVAEESRNCGSVQTTGLVFSVGTGILQVPSQDARVTGLHKRVLQRLLL